MSIFVFLLILIVLILVHEFGHFLAAKRSGVRVDEFGIGFPPKLFGKKFGETEYTLNALPFGGFVKIFGEDPKESEPETLESPRSFAKKPKLIQAMILVAGVFFNLIFAWALFVGGFLWGLPASVDIAPEGATVRDAMLVITGVLPGSPAEKGDIKLGDRVLSAYAGEEELLSPTPETFKEFIQRHEGLNVVINIKRGKEEFSKELVPVLGVVEDDGAAVGVSMDMAGILRLPPGQALIEGTKATWNMTALTAIGLYEFFKTAIFGEADLSAVAGPVGIVGLVGDAGELGFSYLIIFIAVISINLAIINLLPIPGLDGGRLFFLIIEAIKGSPIKQRYANMAHMLGFVLLILLLLVVTYNDIAKLVAG